MLSSAEARERRILAAEEALLRRRKELEREAGSRLAEAEAAVRRLQVECEHQLDIERDRCVREQVGARRAWRAWPCGCVCGRMHRVCAGVGVVMRGCLGWRLSQRRGLRAPCSPLLCSPLTHTLPSYSVPSPPCAAPLTPLGTCLSDLSRQLGS